MTTEKYVTETLLKLGVPAKYKGYEYLKKAILLAYQDHSLIRNMTTQLYPSVAAHFRTTASRVERNIRYAIKQIWEIYNYTALSDALVYVPVHKMTNGEFIAAFVERMKLENMPMAG